MATDTTTKQPEVQDGSDPRGYRIRRFMPDPPSDKELIDKAWALLEGYSGIPRDEIEPHVRAIRDKAWAIFPYGCIGRWRFLDLRITRLPLYAQLLSRTCDDGAVLLDCACGLGQVLRQLAFEGAPQGNLIGADLRQEFVDLGFELFRDREKFGGRFVTGDMLDAEKDGGLATVDGKVDVVHAASFFHLFGWADQVRIGERMVRFFKPKDQLAKPAVVIGAQVGMREPLPLAEHEARGLQRYHHNPQTMQALWDEIGERTGSRWSVTAQLRDLPPEKEDTEEGWTRTIILFEVVRVD